MWRGSEAGEEGAKMPARKEMAQRDPLPHAELQDVIDLALWAGQMLLQHGARTQRVEETVHHLGTGLGCDWLDILVCPNAIVLTTSSGQAFRTKIRRVSRVGVNMSVAAEINALSRRVTEEGLDRHQVRAALERIDQMPLPYNRWLVVVMVGLACAALSRLFGGDAVVFGATFVASATAMWVRQELTRRYFNVFLVVTVTAFVAGILASLPTLFSWGAQPQLALAASVLLLVPGAPLITAAQDLIEGHLVTGLARGLYGSLVSLAIAIGLLLAMWLMGV